MKTYCEDNVYEAAVKRISYMFDEFENIYVSISGGKDSGVCTHMVLDEARKRNRKVGLVHIDIEAAYQHTMDFVKQMYDDYGDVIIPIWICLPMTSNNGLSYIETLWTWWDEKCSDKWVREMPKEDYIINLENNPLTFYKDGITFEEFVVKFGKHYAEIFGDKNSKTACVVGIRTQESLNRWRAIMKEKSTLDGKIFTTQISDNVYNVYPIYDWQVEDIWTYYGKFNKKYNHIYNLMHQAGLSLNQMRIDEPFGNESKVGLNLFKVIEPQTWHKVVGRVSGANIDNIYNKKMKKEFMKLPKGHTWETFTKFLLTTLPKETREHYERKFKTFVDWWMNEVLA